MQKSTEDVLAPLSGTIWKNHGGVGMEDVEEDDEVVIHRGVENGNPRVCAL